MIDYLPDSTTVGLLFVKFFLHGVDFAVTISPLYSMGSLVILMRSRIVICSIFNWRWLASHDSDDENSTGSSGITKLTIILSCLHGYCIMFHYSYCIIIIEVID